MLKKKLILLVLSIIAISFTGCTTSKTYINPTLGISVNYPSDWQVSDNDKNNITFNAPSNSSSSVTISLANSTTTSDPIIILEKISTASLNAGTMESVELPELFHIKDYQVARMQALMKKSYSFNINEEGNFEILDDDSTRALLTSSIPLEIIAIVEGNSAIVVFVQWPHHESQRIVESLSFTN